MSKPALPLLELLEGLQAGTSDDVYALIATEQLYVDLSHTPLADPQHVQVFVDREQATAYTALSQSAWHLFPGSATRSLLPGTLLWWDGKPWRMLNLGETAVTLLSPEKHLLDLTVEVFEDLLRQRKVTVATPLPGDSLPTEEQEILQHASPEELEIATYRYKLLGRALPEETVVPARTDASLAHEVSYG
jgi:putative transposase